MSLIYQPSTLRDRVAPFLEPHQLSQSVASYIIPECSLCWICQSLRPSLLSSAVRPIVFLSLISEQSTYQELYTLLDSHAIILFSSKGQGLENLHRGQIPSMTHPLAVSARPSFVFSAPEWRYNSTS